MEAVAPLNLHERLEARLAIVREDLDEVLGRLSDSLLPWAPAPGMRTIGGQLVEIAGTERQVLSWMRDGRRLSFEEAEAFEGDGSTLAGLTAILVAIRAETLAYLASLSDDDLESLAPFPEGWFESFRQPLMQRSEVLRGIAQHEWYHVGQLTSYLWARGDDPYRW